MKRDRKLKKSRGFFLVEIGVTMFIIAVLSLVLMNFSRYSNAIIYSAQLEEINHSFDKIVEFFLYNDCYNNIGGRKFVGGIISINQIVNNQNYPIYTTRGNPNFNTKEHSIGENIYIQSITIKEGSKFSDGRQEANLEVTYVYDGQESKKTAKLHLRLDDDNNIHTCLINSNCEARRIIPRAIPQEYAESTFIRGSGIPKSCFTKLKEQAELLQKGEEPNFYFDILEDISSNQTLRMHITNSDLDPSCMCLGLFTCLDGYLSEAIKCFDI